MVAFGSNFINTEIESMLFLQQLSRVVIHVHCLCVQLLFLVVNSGLPLDNSERGGA